MPLSPGTRLGPYEIVSPLGSGGMGDVYKARDTRLDRTVAIKLLPHHVLADAAVQARFEREARAVSKLDHPNICVLYDVGREGDLDYLVMQYLEGETLAARLARGAIPLPEALRYATEIAAALDRAHRAGILHRDIKPGNVMLARSAGRDTSATLLDFGLAKALASEGPHAVLEGPPTATSPLTGQGAIVGTLLYMSPEQLEGRDVDARSDIFAFGALLYEMVTGRRAFDGTSQASIIGAILEREPPPMAGLIALTPPALDRVVRKCLAKDRDRRWQSAADLCDELSWIAQSSGMHQPAPVSAPRSRANTMRLAGIAVLALTAIAGVLAWSLGGRRPAPDVIARELAIVMPTGARPVQGGIAVSPDGRSVVFVADASPPIAVGTPTNRSDAEARLYWRRFEASEAAAIPGTEGARTPFFSPDGQSLAYLTSSALFKVSVRGGRPERIGGTPPVTRGGAWLADGSIVVALTHTSGLTRFRPDGKVEPLTTLDAANGEKAHLWPHAMPGGEDVLFTIRRGTTTDMDSADIGLLRVTTGQRRVILKGGAYAQYSPSGHLLFVRGGALSASPFEPGAPAAQGSPTPIVEKLSVDPWRGGAHYAVAPDGTLLFLRGDFPEQRTSGVWVDRAGKSVAALGILGRLPGQPRLSPDGNRALFDAPSPDGDDEVYVADLLRGTAVRLSDDPQDDFDAVWTRDGRTAIWTALAPGHLPSLVMQSADGTGPRTQVLPDPEVAQFAGSVSPSGILAFTRATSKGVFDIWTVPLAGERKGRPLLATPAEEYGPEFSPNGKWMAYVSNESGTPDVYVMPFPGPGPKHRITSSGAGSPAWSRDELFFQAGGALMSVPVTTGTEFTFGTARRLFAGSFVVDSRQDGPRAYDVTPDGKRFLMLVPEVIAAPLPAFHVLLNWTQRLPPR